MLALVWAPIRFAQGWDLAVHLFDFAVFSLLVAATQATTSPFFFLCFLFLLVCGTLRWRVRGTLWTAAAAMAAYAGTSLYAAYVLRAPGFELNTFVIRAVYLTVITAMLASLSAHQHRFQNEIGRIAAWPRRLSRDPHAIVSEILTQARMLLDAPAVVLAWTEPGQGGLSLAWLDDGGANWVESTEAEYRPLVLPSLDGKSFQASDAAQDRGLVIVHSSSGFRRRDGRPINEALRARFDMRAVQSWPLDGELIRGRMFCLNKPKMGIDDLVVGELVARQVVSRLESTLMLERLRDAAALEERVRVAGDLHDSLLQAQAGAALQLLAARRLLDRHPDAARRGLGEVQDQLERGELEMRSFIRGLRPARAPGREVVTMDLSTRLEALRQRIERQWGLSVNLRMDGAVDLVPVALGDEVYRLVQEAVVNAARHAEASVIDVALSVIDAGLGLEVVDNGRGFPFQGTYDLSQLNEMNEGPLALKERVTRLAGGLTLRSMTSGTSLHMKLPIATSSD